MANNGTEEQISTSQQGDEQDQSSEVIQFKMPRMSRSSTLEDGDPEERSSTAAMTDHRHSTPQMPHPGVLFPDQPPCGMENGQQMRGDHGYHGDVWPHSHQVLQGGGDRPPRRSTEQMFQPREQVPKNLLYDERVGGHTNRPLVKPERFDGTEDWNTYIKHFEWVAELNGWNEREKANFLTVSVTGTARQVLAGLPKERLLDYHDVVKVLQSRFDPTGRLELHRIQLKNRVRQPGETLSAVADDIRCLVDRVFVDIPADARDKLARDCFIDALADGEMRIRVIQMHTPTFNEAVEAAIELEAFTKAEKERGAYGSCV